MLRAFKLDHWQPIKLVLNLLINCKNSPRISLLEKGPPSDLFSAKVKAVASMESRKASSSSSSLLSCLSCFRGKPPAEEEVCAGLINSLNI